MNGTDNSPNIGLLVEILDHGFDKVSWHGPNLTGGIRGVGAKLAARRLPGRKTIWEQTLHAAYWKQIVLNKIVGTEKFSRRGSNWPPMPEKRTEQTWRADVQLLHDIHRKLRAAVQNMSPDRLDDPKLRRMIHGAAFHDIYHAGQIRLLRKMMRPRVASA